MKNKILLFGYKPYLSSILVALKNTPFLIENEIVIIYAKPNKSNRFKTFYKNFKKASFKKIISTIFIKLNYLMFIKRWGVILETVFPLKDTSFLIGKENIVTREYDGLENINDLSTFDFMVVASFGEKIPKAIYNSPKGRTLNIHPSYLPKLRGGYPTYVEACQMSDHGGVTIHYMEDSWDDGDIVLQQEYQVNPNATNQERLDNSANIAGQLLNDLNQSEFKIKPMVQNEAGVSYCHRVLKYHANITDINDNLKGHVLANHSASLFPFTFGFYRGMMVSILQLELISENSEGNDICFFYENRRFYLIHSKCKYLITKYIYNGKLID